jgi:hypothetical protein
MTNRIVLTLAFLGVGLGGAGLSGCTPAGDTNPDNGSGSGGARVGTGGSSAKGGSGGSNSGGKSGDGGGSGGVAPAGSGGAGAGSGGQSGSGGGGAESGGSTGSDGGTSDAPVAGDTATPPPKGEVGGMGFPGWKYLSNVKMDTTGTGAPVTGNVANYPVAVVLNATNFDFSQAKGQGEDVRFGKADGTPIPYAIESFDAASKSAVFWVLIDQVMGNNNTQSFNMYWGNAAAGDASDSGKVFGATYLGVWHLNEDAGSAEGGYKDASVAGSHATGVNVVAGSRVDGAIGKGVKLQNSMRQWVKVEDAGMKFRPAAMTATLWGWADGFPAKWGSGGSPGYQTIYSSGEAWTVQRETGAKFECCFNQNCGIGKGMNTKEWVHFGIIRSGGNFSLYMNGVKVSGGGAPARNDAKPLGIGQQTQYLDPVKNANEQRSWEGILDEARVMNVAVSTDWLMLDYQSQKPGAKFLSFGVPQTR